ncbi:protein Star-like [Palaemon carinicauda]|uniref:protein Star-like n=1 Tax=Palaemon carinicauda TaxID=392227 RepID=UPI0035B67FA1
MGKMGLSPLRVILPIVGTLGLMLIIYPTKNTTVTSEPRPIMETPNSADEVQKSNNGNQLQNSSVCNCSPYDFRGADQEDPRLIEYIRRELLVPPSVQPYKLARSGAVHFSQFNQSRIANEMLRGMKDGFFVEVGAADGESLSNSIFFERELGWRGLLIEAIPSYFEALKKKHRKAYAIHAALSQTTSASEVSMKANGYGSKLSAHGITVKGLPLFSILQALDVKVVDFLSLDIESFEVKILKTIPWDKIKFRLMCIEVAHIPEGKEFLTKFLQEKGYEFLGLGYLKIDAWYSHPDLLKTNVKPH